MRSIEQMVSDNNKKKEERRDRKLKETGRKGETDLSQLQFAVSEKRTIITFNVKDFVLLYNQLYSEGKKHSGIIVSSQLNFKETLKRLLNHKSAKDIENTIEFLNSWK